MEEPMQKDQNQERGNLPASEKMLWDYLLIIVFVTESENWITIKSVISQRIRISSLRTLKIQKNGKSN